MHGHRLKESRVSGSGDPEFLVCVACWMYCMRPQYCHRGLAKACNGAQRAGAPQSKKGSRAQARTDFSKSLLPGKEKQPIDKLARPTAATRARWAEALGTVLGPADRADPEAPAGSKGSAVDPPEVLERAPDPPAPEGLFRPGLEGVLGSFGFASAAEAQERGRRARAARIVDPRPEIGQREE